MAEEDRRIGALPSSVQQREDAKKKDQGQGRGSSVPKPLAGKGVQGLEKEAENLRKRIKDNNYTDRPGFKAGSQKRDDETRLKAIERTLTASKSKGYVGRASAGATLARGGTKAETTKVAGAYRAALTAETTKQKAKKNTIRTMFGLQPFVAEGMLEPDYILDAEGNPTDKFSGYKVSEEFEGITFGQRMTGNPRGGSNVKPQNASLSMLQGMSVKEVFAFYQSLTPDELKQVQHQMVMAGLYEIDGGKPRLGFRDKETTQALYRLMEMWGSDPDMSAADLLKTLTSANRKVIDEKLLAKAREESGSALSDLVQDVTITDSATLNGLIDEVSQELFGEWLPLEKKQALIDKLQSQERSYATTQAAATDKARAADPANKQDIDHFMDALIGQESGGREDAVNERTGAAGLGQMLYWNEWAREAGVDPADFSGANQRRVIRYKVSQYYEAYGNWRDVAIAWYSGSPGSAWSAATLNKPQGAGDEPSMNEYADSLLSRMEGFRGGVASDATQPGSQQSTTVNFSDTQASARTRAEQELKQADPAKYFGTQFAKQAEGFFKLLGGVKY